MEETNDVPENKTAKNIFYYFFYKIPKMYSIWLNIFKIASVSEAPPIPPLGELATFPQTLLSWGLLAFGNRSFGPSALRVYFPPWAQP